MSFSPSSNMGENKNQNHLYDVYEDTSSLFFQYYNHYKAKLMRFCCHKLALMAPCLYIEDTNTLFPFLLKLLNKKNLIEVSIYT